MKEFIRNNFADAQKTLELFVGDHKNMQAMDGAVETLAQAYKKGKRAFSCGNGGSMCDAMHFAEELTGRFRKDRPPLPAMAVSDPSHLTCVTNDYGADHVFSRIVEAWGQEGDVLLAISTSGNSSNIIKAVEAARGRKMKVIGLLGKDGGKLSSMVDFPLVVPAQVSDRIQEVHIKIIHTFIEGVERVMFPSHY